MPRFNVKMIGASEAPPPKAPPRDMKPNAITALHGSRNTVSYEEAPIDDYEEAPKKKHLTKLEKRKNKMAKASAGIKGLMTLEPTKKMVEEYIAHRIAELTAEAD
jgi:hypothetical protein